MNKFHWFKNIPRPIKGIGAFFLTYFLWAILDSIINKQKLIDALIAIPNKLLKLNVPDVIFATFIFVIIIILILYNRRFRGLTINRFKELFADKERMQRHINQLVDQMNDFLTKYQNLSKEDRELLDGIKPYVNRLKGMDTIFFNNAIWIKDPSSKTWDGPFCSTCFEAKGLQIHLLQSRSPVVFACRNCQRSVVCSGPPPNNPEAMQL